MSSNTPIDPNLIAQINKELYTSGERDRLKQLLHNKLQESSWFVHLQEAAIAELEGKPLDSINPQVLADRMMDKGISMVDPTIKQEIIEEIKNFLDKHIKIQ